MITGPYLGLRSRGLNWLEVVELVSGSNVYWSISGKRDQDSWQSYREKRHWAPNCDIYSHRIVPSTCYPRRNLFHLSAELQRHRINSCFLRPIHMTVRISIGHVSVALRWPPYHRCSNMVWQRLGLTGHLIRILSIGASTNAVIVPKDTSSPQLRDEQFDHICESLGHDRIRLLKSVSSTVQTLGMKRILQY